MFFRLSSVVLLFALVVLGTPVKRDAQTIYSDIDNIVAKVQALDNSIKALPSSPTYVEALGVHDAAGQLSNAIQAATTDVTGSPPFTEEESSTLVQRAATYVPLVEGASNDIISKKDAFQQLVGGQSIVLNDLKLLKQNADDFGAAVEAKVTDDQQSNAQQQVDAVDAALTGAIDAYE